MGRQRFFPLKALLEKANGFYGDGDCCYFQVEYTVLRVDTLKETVYDVERLVETDERDEDDEGLRNDFEGELEAEENELEYPLTAFSPSHSLVLTSIFFYFINFSYYYK